LQEVQAFGDDPAVGQTLDGVANSAANLTLHLEGNLREYVGRLVGNIAYSRDRPVEFSARDATAESLIPRIEALRELIPGVISKLSEQDLDAIYPQNVLNVPLTTRQFLIHLFGHFSYHLGQIDYLRRILMHSTAIPLAGLKP
jgi:uncharacterized damage-inducible protein DinB